MSIGKLTWTYSSLSDWEEWSFIDWSSILLFTKLINHELVSIAELTHSLTHELEICKERACTSTHLLSFWFWTFEADSQVSYTIIKYFYHHFSSYQWLFRFWVRERRVNTNCTHTCFCIVFRRERYLHFATFSTSKVLWRLTSLFRRH